MVLLLKRTRTVYSIIRHWKRHPWEPSRVMQNKPVVAPDTGQEEKEHGVKTTHTESVSVPQWQQRQKEFNHWEPNSKLQSSRISCRTSILCRLKNTMENSVGRADMLLGQLSLLFGSSKHRLPNCLPNLSLCTQGSKQAPSYLWNCPNIPQACGMEQSYEKCRSGKSKVAKDLSTALCHRESTSLACQLHIV